MTAPLESANGRAQNTQLKGVRGWLLLFCLVVTILNPIVYLIDAATSGGFVVWAVDLALSCLAIATGASVWTQRRSALKLVKAYFISVLCLIILGAVALMVEQLAGSPLPTKGEKSGLLGVIIWWLYFNKSKRVRATFGANL